MKLHERLRSESGFGLVEVVVSMLVLATLALAFLPVLVSGLKQSAANATLATATQLVNERMQIVQAPGISCSTISLYAVESSTVDQQGVTITVATVVGPCPDATGTVLVTSTATDADTGRTLAEASTRVLI